jgi:hypothetical protein
MVLEPGRRLASAVCETEVIVIRAPADEVDLRCGGQPMVGLDEAPAARPGPEAPHDAGTLIGKRYADPELGLEVLCTKAGAGSLSIGDDALAAKEARPLPSSD